MKMNSNLENFRPRLRAGRVIPQGSRIVFETDDPYNQVILPMALADLVLLCSGQFSVREIVAKIYKKQGAVPFKSILKALHVLHQGGFFANGDELSLNSELHSWIEPKRARFHISWRLLQRVVSDRPWPNAYYVVSLGALIGAMFGLQFFPSSPFRALEDWVRAQAGWQAALELLSCSSVLMTLKQLLRASQQLLGTGKTYNLGLRLGPFGAHLQVGNEANDLFGIRLYTVMFYASQILAPWLFVLAASPLIPPDWLMSTVVAALVMTFWELNPFVNSDGLRLIQSIVLPDDAEVASWHFETTQLIDAISPEQRQVDQEFARLCAIWGAIWLVLAFSLLHESAIRFGALTLSAFRGGGTGAAVAAIPLLTWLVSLYLTIQTCIEVVLVTLVRPHLRWVGERVRGLVVRETQAWDGKKVSGMIESLPIFSHFHEEFMQMIISQSQVLEVPRGTTILRNGDVAREIYVLLSGDVTISRVARNGQMEIISHLAPVSIFGEAALIDDSSRAAEVRARTHAVVLRVQVAVLREVARQAQSVRHLDDFRNAILVNQFFASSPVFRSLSPESVDFLSSRGTLEYFDRERVVFRQGEVGDSLYLILRGAIDVQVHGRRVKRLFQGSFFGEISLIANLPRTATIICAEPCVFFRISSDAFWEVLVQNLDLGVFLETISESRLKEDLELAGPRAAGDGSE